LAGNSASRRLDPDWLSDGIADHASAGRLSPAERVAAALRELSRLERTLFTLDWIEDPELRRGTGHELNKV
jgi:TnpA family transposase